MIIYKVTNLINGKIYIGQTIKSLEKRKMAHIWKAKNNGSFYFYRALNKYGIENFKWKVICICPNLNSLNKQEEYYIVYYDSMNNGYNCTSGGLNSLHSKETKNKIRQFQLGHIVSSKTRKKISENHAKSMLGRSHTKKTKQKISKANKGKEGVRLFGKKNGMYGRCYSEKQRKYLSKINLGKKVSKETRNKMSKNNVGMKGRHHTQETKKKISNALLGNKNRAKNIS